jgi:hypothetical protein
MNIEHSSRLDRLAGDVSLGDGAPNNALTADFVDLNETGFPVRVKAGPGPSPIFNRDEPLWLLSRSGGHFVLHPRQRLGIRG